MPWVSFAFLSVLVGCILPKPKPSPPGGVLGTGIRAVFGTEGSRSDVGGSQLHAGGTQSAELCVILIRQKSTMNISYSI